MTKYKATNKVKELTFGTDSARKRDFVFSTLSRPQVNTASYWSEGSKDNYKVINLDTKQTIIPPAGSYPMFQAEYTMKPGDVLINTGVCCGKPSQAYIYCLAEDETRVRAWLGIPLVLT